MKPSPKLGGDEPAAQEVAKQYASREEVDRALCALTQDDHVKLRMIAKVFCRLRRLAPNVIDQDDLLSEAIMATCRMKKRWNKEMSMVRHLDRAMENISGHIVEKAVTGPIIVPFPDSPWSEEDMDERVRRPQSAEDSEVEHEKCAKLLREVFGDDDIAIQVFTKRVEKAPIAGILNALKLTTTDYDTICRRIRRKIAAYVR